MKRATNGDKAEIIIKSGRRASLERPVRHLQEHPQGLHEGQKVLLTIGEETRLGFMAVINNRLEGILYKNEVFQPLEKGQKVEGFIKKIREDNKIDLCLHKTGFKKVELLSQKFLKKIIAAGGFIPVTDKSAPETISELFGVSKTTYKMIVGGLYKRRLIAIEDNGIRLIEDKAHPPSIRPRGDRASRQTGSRRRAQV